MGWKTFREHYGIAHIVKIEDGNLHVGSAYVGDAIVVAPDGRIISKPLGRPGALTDHAAAIAANPETAARLIAEPDVFDRSIPVYTWKGDEIVEAFCEETGWPNMTHDGDLMYENRYTTDRDQAVEWARLDAEAALEHCRRSVEQAERDLEHRQGLLREAERIAASIAERHPFNPTRT